MITSSLIALLMLLGQGGAPSATAQVRLDFVPSTARLSIGERTLVSIEGQDVPAPGLAALQFTMQFAPTMVDVANPNEAFRSFAVAPFAPLGGHPLCGTIRNTGETCPDPPWLLTTTGRSPLGVDTIDRRHGRVQVAYATSGAQAPPTGHGAVALLEIVGLAEGETVINLAEVILADNRPMPQPFPVVHGTLTITVVPRNTAPVAVERTVTTLEDTTVSLTLEATDGEEDALTFAVLTLPTHGTLHGTPPAVTYTPAADFHGTDHFTFQAHDGLAPSNVAPVTVTVTPVNDAPMAVPQVVTTAEDTALNVTLTATDVDPGTTLRLTIVQHPAHGTVSGTPPSVTYTPTADFHGTDRFTFQAHDGLAPSNVAPVSVTVTPVNDAPLAVPQVVTTTEDTALNVTLTATDRDTGTTLRLTIVQHPAHGTVSGTPPAVTYTPTADFHGTDRFTFQAHDGLAPSNVATVAITIRPVNDPPVLDPIGSQHAHDGQELSLVFTATDPDGDALRFTAGNLPVGAALTDHGDGMATFIWTPGWQDVGNFKVLFRVTDNGSPMASDFEKVVITVDNVNRPPILAPIGAKNVRIGERLSFRVSANDPDNDPLVWRALGLPTGATFAVRNNRSAIFVWTPGFQDAGNVVVRFMVTDKGTPPEWDFEDVRIAVGNVKRLPILTPLGAQTVDQGMTTTVPVTAYDPNGDSLHLAIDNLPAFATFSDNGDGTGWLTFVAQEDDTGVYPEATLTVTNTSAPDLFVSEQFTVRVNEVGAPPQAPTGFTASLTQFQVALQWSASSGATHFRLFRRLHRESQFREIGHQEGLVYTDYLPQGTLSAAYFVIAENLFGISAASATVTVTPDTGGTR